MGSHSTDILDQPVSASPPKEGHLVYRHPVLKDKQGYGRVKLSEVTIVGRRFNSSLFSEFYIPIVQNQYVFIYIFWIS